jgi:hypothetical protein
MNEYLMAKTTMHKLITAKIKMVKLTMSKFFWLN